MTDKDEIERLKLIIDKQHQELQYFKEQFKLINDKLSEEKPDKPQVSFDKPQVSFDKYWWKDDTKLFKRINNYINKYKNGNSPTEPSSWLKHNVYGCFPVSKRIELTEKDKKRILKYIVCEIKS